MFSSQSYNPNQFEPEWQRVWEETRVFQAFETRSKPKFYCLDFFPYPSGEGLHVGHCRNYIPTDLISRYKRMQGYNVLHPMGWDAFGEPAEQFAIAHGVHPQVTTKRNAANYKRQMRMIGNGYDWSREINSSDPKFYTWTQLFFLLLYKRGLAYRDTNWQWWCPTCATTLSSHEINGDKCWRGHSGVTKREIPAWYFKITAYADELISELEDLDWPDSIKTMQRNWIGRSEGCEINFRTTDGQLLPTFTTRPDTVFGATFVVLAPEHPLVAQLTTSAQKISVDQYIAMAIARSEIERTSESKEKTGVFTGGHVINPMSKELVQVWIADYVLPTYGTGAVMGVPAHDQRDFEFAEKYKLPVKVVIAPPDYDGSPIVEAYTGPGRMINANDFNDIPNEEGIDHIIAYLEQQNLGGRKIYYRMRDWLISRQRYWGAPIPIVYCDGCGELPIPEEQLPVRLPPMDNFEPDGSGRSPLARAHDFYRTKCPICDSPATRETDTMGGFACSSWYFIRFTSPHFHEGPFKSDAMKYWMPVDLYVGGAEHAVLHLLYARFWTKVIADAGLVPFREPFVKLLNQGTLHGSDGYRMSKSRGNVITPDSMVNEYSADALRIYCLFMAPFDQDVYWNTEGANGAHRFLVRVWKLFQKTHHQCKTATDKDPDLENLLHKTIKEITHRIEDFRFNTMVSLLMEFINVLWEQYREGRWMSATFYQALEQFLVLLAPAAPHITEELWHMTGHSGSVHAQSWPSWDVALVVDDTMRIAIQINGRTRDVIEFPVASNKEEIQEIAFASPRVQKHLTDTEITRLIYVPGKILNIVT